jgi:hypothetical protein
VRAVSTERSEGETWERVWGKGMGLDIGLSIS